jgi:hypothetical protein
MRGVDVGTLEGSWYVETVVSVMVLPERVVVVRPKIEYVETEVSVMVLVTIMAEACVMNCVAVVVLVMGSLVVNVGPGTLTVTYWVTGEAAFDDRDAERLVTVTVTTGPEALPVTVLVWAKGTLTVDVGPGIWTVTYCVLGEAMLDDVEADAMQGAVTVRIEGEALLEEAVLVDCEAGALRVTVTVEAEALQVLGDCAAEELRVAGLVWIEGLLVEARKLMLEDCEAVAVAEELQLAVTVRKDGETLLVGAGMSLVIVLIMVLVSVLLWISVWVMTAVEILVEILVKMLVMVFAGTVEVIILVTVLGSGWGLGTLGGTPGPQCPKPFWHSDKQCSFVFPQYPHLLQQAPDTEPAQV